MNLTRNTRPRPGRVPARLAPQPQSVESASPRPDWSATGVAVTGILLTMIVAGGHLPSELASQSSYGVLISLGASIAIEMRRGIRNIIRADILAIITFYYLTLYEYLFRQPHYDASTSLAATSSALLVVHLGMLSLLLGRHVPRPERLGITKYLEAEVPVNSLLTLFWIATFLGYFYMLACVSGNPITMLDEMMGPRFSQPWQRGQLGDWRSMFTELTLLLYLIPALAGVMLARPERYGMVKLIPVLVALAVTLFSGFVTGTRNVFGAYLVNFLVGYAFACPAAKRMRVAGLGVACALAMGAATYFMLQFREVGVKAWLRGEYEKASTLQSDFVFVDYNLLTIATMTDFYPTRHPFLGAEIPYLAVIRPIPRFLWPGKPKGMSKSIEEIMGYDEGVTISATFAGEAYISGGYTAVILIGLVLGAISGAWSLMASPKNSELGILVYASGFFAAVISMRSLFTFTTAMLPTVASLVLVILLVRAVQAGGKKVATMFQKHSIAPRPQPAPPRGPVRPALSRTIAASSADESPQ